MRIIVQVPLSLSTASETELPTGRSFTWNDRDSEPSTSASKGENVNSTVSSSSVSTSETVMAGSSATASTITVNVDISVVDCNSFDNSTEVAEIDRSKSSPSFSGGRMVSPTNWSRLKVYEPSSLSVPLESKDPMGRLSTRNEIISEPSSSTGVTVISTAICKSSSP